MQPDNPTEPVSGLTDNSPPVGILAAEGPAIETVGSQDVLSPNAPPGLSLSRHHTRWEYRCKICQLAIKFPTLYKMLHDLVLKDCMSYNAAVVEVNSYIKQHRLEINTFNMMNILTHFNRHVDIKSARTELIIAHKSGSTEIAPSAVRPLQKYVDGLVEAKARSEADDYENMDEIRRRVTAVMQKLMDELEEKDQVDGTLRMSKHGMQLFIGLVGETRNCINDLNKMRQSEKLMNTVVQELLDRMTFAIVPQLLSEYRSLSEELRSRGVGQDVIDMADLRLRTKTHEIIVTTARAAISEVQRRFKLR